MQLQQAARLREMLPSASCSAAEANWLEGVACSQSLHISDIGHDRVSYKSSKSLALIHHGISIRLYLQSRLWQHYSPATQIEVNGLERKHGIGSSFWTVCTVPFN